MPVVRGFGLFAPGPVSDTGTVPSFTIGEIRLTRVPYFDVPLDAEVVGLTAQDVAGVPWSMPNWATTDGQVIIGQAIWVVESGDQTVVVDPCGAADDFLRTGPEAAGHEEAVLSAMAGSGFPVESVDTVIMSHLDGIGMIASVKGSRTWTPLFPNPRVVISTAELASVDASPATLGAPALGELVEQGAVDGTEPPVEIAPGVVMELTGGHTPGHSVIRIADGAVFVGHLAVNPVQVSGGVMPGQHAEPVTAFTALEAELTWAVERHALVIGPLWPEPGAARVAGPPWSLVPA